jgi:quercetin dioxygenase-like cupin family protein
LNWFRTFAGLPIASEVAEGLPLFGADPNPGPVLLSGPQGFIVRRGSESGVLHVHYHPVDQFQVVVGGSGTFAGSHVGPGHVHYADSLQPYGPIDQGPDGLAFLTLRATPNAGASFMPESRAELALALKESGAVVNKRRNISFDLATTPPAGAGWTMVHSEADGLSILRAAVADGEHLPVANVAGAGAYVVVLSGAAHVDGQKFDPGDFAWCPKGSTVHGVAGGSRGLDACLLQLPEGPRPHERDLAPLHV